MSTGFFTDRRGFLRSTGGVVCAGMLGAGPLYGLASECHGANERVRLALIGCGVRGRQLSTNLPAGCEVVALADADRSKAESTAAELGGEPGVYDDYRFVLDRQDVDGVLICTTDHHHAHAGVLASIAGIDSYVEKPLTICHAEGKALVAAARRYDRVVQVGTQQRSMEMNRFACELVRDGGIGEVRVAEFVNYAGASPYPADGLGEQPTPPGVNWDAWQGPAPNRPFNRLLAAHWSDGLDGWWGDWREYSVGQIGGMGAHGFDMLQYALGTDDTGPVELWPVGRDETGTLRVDFRYANGVEVRLRYPDKRPFRGPRLGTVITGSKCKIEINRNRFRTNPPDFAAAEAPDQALADRWNGPGWIARGHIEDWLDAIKTRRRPRADIAIGHRAATLSHLVDITRCIGRRIRWDPDQEVFPDEPDANRLLSLPRRKGWELPS